MWLLKDNYGNIRYLRPNTTVNVGRKQTDIILENDSSISRVHATIIVTLKKQIKISENSSNIIVKDTNSKYGTLVIRNGMHIRVSNTGLELEPSDIIKFGLQHHIYKIEYIHFITVISRLSKEHKNMLKYIMDSIGGIIVDYYDECCTHLTTTTAASTNKIIFALIAGIPIINISYWISVQNAIEKNGNLPDPNLFTLPLKDKGVNTQCISLKPNPLRKTIFQGKKFIFYSQKPYMEYKRMITEAGGKVELYETNFKNISEDIFTDNNIIMQITDENIINDVTKFNSLLCKKMQQKKIRMIAVTEIPLALVYVSLEQFCNPKYRFKELMNRKDLMNDTSKIFALDTEDILLPMPPTQNACIPKFTKICIPETEKFTEDILVQDVENDCQSMHLNSNKINIEKVDLLNVSENINIVKPKLFEKLVKDTNFVQTITSELEGNLEVQNTLSIEDDNGKVEHSWNTQNFEYKNKKRPFEKLLSFETSQNTQDILKTKNEKESINVYKKRKILPLESKKVKQKSDIKNPEDKFNKWGFKKSKTKIIDFDLDDINLNEPKIQNSSLNSIVIHKEFINILTETNSIVHCSKNKSLCSSNTRNESDELIKKKLLETNQVKFHNEDFNKWISIKPKKMKDIFKTRNSLQNETSYSFPYKSSMIRKSNVNINECRKVFRKVYNEIPTNRILITNMAIWTPSTKFC